MNERKSHSDHEELFSFSVHTIRHLIVFCYCSSTVSAGVCLRVPARLPACLGTAQLSEEFLLPVTPSSLRVLASQPPVSLMITRHPGTHLDWTAPPFPPSPWVLGFWRSLSFVSILIFLEFYCGNCLCIEQVPIPGMVIMEQKSRQTWFSYQLLRASSIC